MIETVDGEDIVGERGLSLGQNPSTVFDRAGRLLISYYDNTHRDLKLATSNGEDWSYEIIDAEGRFMVPGLGLRGGVGVVQAW